MKLQLKNRELKTVIILSLLALILVAPDFASAGIVESITKGVVSGLASVVLVVIGVVFSFIGFITGALLAIAVTIFNWVASPNFISLSYTNPAGNAFLAVGWGLTRSLANIVFVIALVVIGIGTALRISGYQMQKTLPTLIIIALLVNFTPVICGLIVDASNIVMNFFMSTALGEENPFVETASRQVELVKDMLGHADFWEEGETPKAMAAVAGSIAINFFNIIAMVIYLLFAVLLIIRYVAIWLLVILSPFAFVCYILPKTRGVWNMWWKTFIQWSILGIIMGFFVFLANSFIVAFITIDGAESELNILGTSVREETTKAPGLSVIFNSLIPWSIPLVLLMVGLFASISGAPAGAQGIMRMAQKVPGQVFSATRKFATSAAKGIPAISRAEEKVRRRLETAPLIGRAMGGPGAYTRELAKDRGEAKKKLENLPPEELDKIIKMRPLSRQDRVRRAATAEVLAEKGWLKQKHNQYLSEAIEFGVPEKTINKVAPHLIFERAEEKATKEKDATKATAIRAEAEQKFTETINKLKVDDVDKLSDEAKTDEGVIKAVIKTKKTDLINRLSSQNTQTQQAVQKQIDEGLGQRWKNREQFDRGELELLRRFHTNPYSGVTPVGELSEIEEKIKDLGAGPKPSETPPPGVPSGWVRGPGGTWVPPSGPKPTPTPPTPPTPPPPPPPSPPPPKPGSKRRTI